ncbi:OB-fold nucleic acid binding domain-containing protein [Diplocarpon rosae]|nr:OB-fold nucleic acid binding domain-containing protein [Diplocarpon rosae]
MNAKDHIYPDYCHCLSPTIGKWCPLLVTDVHRLRNVGMFSDERPLYHLDNHPVKWVRITGVVVAVDEFRGKKVYVVDDSSGMTVECTAIAPAPAGVDVGDGRPKHPEQVAAGMVAPLSKLSTYSTGNLRKEGIAKEKKVGGHRPRRGASGEEVKSTPSVQTPLVPWQLIDVGAVVKVKGRIGEWWGTLQIEVVKMDVMRGVDEEVRCWDEVIAFRKGVVGAAWVVDEEMEERLRKVRERELRGGRRKAGKMERKVGERAGKGEFGERRKRTDGEKRERIHKREKGRDNEVEMPRGKTKGGSVSMAAKRTVRGDDECRFIKGISFMT